jgi:hypothetical protein
VAKLKLGALEDDKPRKGAVEFAAAVYRDLEVYAELLAQQTGKPVSDPMKLVPHMVERFMATDRAFSKARRDLHARSPTVRNSVRDQT